MQSRDQRLADRLCDFDGPYQTGIDLARPGSDMNAFRCRCGAPQSWSAPDQAPTECWNCGARFIYDRR